MAVTPSNMMALGTTAPAYRLPDANPRTNAVSPRTLADDADAEVLVVVFTCNHCPYAVHVEDALIETARDYAGRGVAFVAISSNDAEKYPADGFDAMAQRAEAKAFPFPYLYDETQEVARAYQAACTPDTYVFDAERQLVYRGRLDATRPGQGKATAADLRAALEAVLSGGAPPQEQVPSVGCNIKWK